MRNNKIISAVFLVLLFNYGLIGGDTNFSTSSRAKTLSLNGMYFAGADGLQPVLGNPSSLSLLTSGGIEFNIVDYIGQNEFENLQSGLYKSYSDDEFNFGGGFYWSFSESFIAAVSYQRAVDYKVDWPYAKIFSNDSLSSLLTFDFSNEISIDAASASFAFSFDQFSIGGSANFYFVEHHTSFPRFNERWNQGLGLPAYQFSFSQDGYSFGFNLGASMQLNDGLRISVMTRSGYKTDLEGMASGNMFLQLDSSVSVVNLNSTFEMPWVFGGGLLYEWSDRLKINFDFQYNLWNSIQKTFNLVFDNSTWQQNLSSLDSLTGINAAGINLSFDNTFDAGIGMEYKTSDVILRVGYRFSQTPNTIAAYNMLFPSVDLHQFSLGFGYHKENIIIDAAVAYAFGVQKDVIKAGIVNLSGNYNATLILPTITFRYLL